jgi:hypothetical protein
VLNSGGHTTFVQTASVGGYDNSEQALVMTGNIYQSIENDGKFFLDQAMSNCDPWTLVERQDIIASGDTELLKQVTVWTEDPTVYRGDLKYPTEAWVEFGFASGDPLVYTWDNAYFLMDEPPAETNIGRYTKQISTEVDFNAFEKVGINTYPSTYAVPPRPTLPDFFCLWNTQN